MSGRDANQPAKATLGGGATQHPATKATERDANQLAADVLDFHLEFDPKGFCWPVVVNVAGGKRSATNAEIALWREREELVGLVGTLQQTDDALHFAAPWDERVSLCGNWNRRLTPMDDKGDVGGERCWTCLQVRDWVGTLQQERDAAWAVDRHGFQLSEPRWSILEIERWLLALGADEELRAAMAGAFRAVAAEAALAEARQALTDVLDCKGSFNGTVSERGGEPAICTKCEGAARRALAATGGDTA